MTYDKNGNLTGDGTNSYKWDAQNRMVEIEYPGSGNKSLFAYDGWGRNIQILEYSGGTLTTTKYFVWCGDHRCETRDASSAVTAQYFDRGQTISGTNYFYTKDKPPGSTREVTNGSNAIVWQASYEPWGNVTVLQGTTTPDSQYAGYYDHSRSGLCLTKTRAYNASFGRFTGRDPIQDITFKLAPKSPKAREPKPGKVFLSGDPNIRESQLLTLTPHLQRKRLVELNTYAYAANNPISYVDPQGTGISLPDLCKTFPWLPGCKKECPHKEEDGNDGGGGDGPDPFACASMCAQDCRNEPNYENCFQDCYAICMGLEG